MQASKSEYVPDPANFLSPVFEPFSPTEEEAEEEDDENVVGATTKSEPPQANQEEGKSEDAEAATAEDGQTQQ